MIGKILMNVLGGPIAKILISGYKARLDAGNTNNRIAADLTIKEIESDMEARQHAKEIRMATSGFWEMRLMTFAIAFPFVSHLWAVWMDTQFGWFRDRCWMEQDIEKCGIPAFPSPFDEWEGAILLSFFGIYTVGKGIQTVGTAIAMRRRI